jgi:hypothetical protein
MTTTFEEAKVGDRVWDVLWGWGTIEGIKMHEDYPIRVKFDGGRYDYFTVGGFIETENNNRSLFWDEVKLEAPERPKRKVKKTYECWCLKRIDGYSIYYSRKENAELYQQDYEGSVIIHLTGEYEVEE